MQEWQWFSTKQKYILDNLMANPKCLMLLLEQCPHLSYLNSLAEYVENQPVPHIKTFYLMSRVGNAGGLLHLYSASMGGWQEAHGGHAGLLLWHQRAPAATTVPWGHRPHRWGENNAPSPAIHAANCLHYNCYFQNLLHTNKFPELSVAPVFHLCTDIVMETQFPSDKA